MKKRQSNATRIKKQKIVAMYADCGSIAECARVIGISANYIFVMQRSDPKFKSRMDDAHAKFCGKLESTLANRVLYGTERPIYQRGELVGYETQYSDKLMEIALKANMPDKYREKQDSSPIAPVVNIINYSKEDKEQLVEVLTPQLEDSSNE